MLTARAEMPGELHSAIIYLPSACLARGTSEARGAGHSAVLAGRSANIKTISHMYIFAFTLITLPANFAGGTSTFHLFWVLSFPVGCGGPLKLWAEWPRCR